MPDSRQILYRLIAAALSLLSVAGAGARPAPAPDGAALASVPAIDLGATTQLADIIPALTDKRVVFIGELHNRYDHHLTQLEIIRRLHAANPRIAIGLEAFQQPFQASLDDYLAGRLDEPQMLRATEYYRRWRMDYRHYAPILRYAREQGLPLVALNVATELTRRVGQVGLDGLSEDERAQLPDEIGPADAAYRQRIKTVFDFHPKDSGQSFEHFLDAQLLWDEGMADAAAKFLTANPSHTLIVIAGNQHIAWGSAIPDRLQRRLELPAASILNSWEGPLGPALADYLLLPEARQLPPSGKIGALLDEAGQPVTVTQCVAQSACAEAGLRRGDRIVAIDEAPVEDIADLRLAMWDKRPGDVIRLGIVRKRFLLTEETLHYELTLK